MDDPISDVAEAKNSRRSQHKRRKDCSKAKEKKWRTEIEKQIYSSKLAEALRHACRRPSVTGRLVRETADRVLAVEAKGRSRWSRAILRSRLRQRLTKRRNPRKLIGRTRSQFLEMKNGKRNPVQRKAKILGLLVPGCRKISFPNLLEEATDYISALEMQVKAMAALVELLAGEESRL